MDYGLMLLDLVAVGCGIYCLSTWLRLLIGGKLFRNGLLVPREKQISDCSDEKAYIAYIRPRLGILGILAMAYGVFSVVNSVTELLHAPWDNLPWIAVMAALVWFAVCNGRANREYFGM